MKSLRICLVLMLFCASGTQLANAATYFTRQTGPWNQPSTWSTVGYGGAAAVTTPTAADIVRIGNNNLVTLNVNATVLQLFVDDTGTLSLDGFGINVLGTTTIGNGVSGIINTVNSATGTKQFTGAVTVNAGATWSLTNTNPVTSFGGGISVAAGATFNNGAGAAAFTANQNLSGAGNLTFGGTVTPSAGTTLVNNNTGSVTILNPGSIVLTGNFTQGANSTLNVQSAAPFSGAGTFNANANVNTVNYSGAAQTIKQVTYSTLTLSNSGAKTFAGAVAVNGSFNMSGSATATTNISAIGASVNLTGTAVMTNGANLTVGQQLNVGTGTTLNLGAFTFSVGTTTSVTGSVLTTGGATGTKTFTGAVTINAGGVWNLSGQNPATSFAGGIAMNGTTFNNGTGATAFTTTQALSGAQAMTFGGVMTPSGGTTLTNSNTSTVTVTNGITLTGNFTQGANSTLILSGATPFSGAGTLNASANTNLLNYSGAAQTVRPVNYSSLTLSGSGTKTITSVSSISGNLTLSGTLSATAANNIDIGGNITLGTGTTFIAGAFTHTVAGNWVNNGGTFTSTNSTIILDGATQSVGGTNSTTFNNLTIAGTGTTTLALATTITNTIDIREGVVANLGGLTTHTANRLRLGGNGQVPGTWGGTGSGATNISSDFFTASSGRITIAVTTTQALPFVEPFNGEADGTTVNLVPSWSVTQFPSGGTFEKSTPVILLGDEGFTVSGTGAQEGVWQTADLTIGANVAEVGISLEVSTLFTGLPNDYVSVYYVWDGGLSTSEILIATVDSDFAAPFIVLPATGHTKIRLVVRAKETSTFFGIPFEMAFDNVTIFPIRTLYSRATANWATSGTWSAVAINGADCACTPSAAGYDKVFIGGGRTVTLGAAGATSNLTVYGTADVGGAGTLNLNASGLTVDYGGNITVNAGGIITGGASSSITISDTQSHTIANNGSITTGGLTFDNSSRYTAVTNIIAGSGTFTTGNLAETTTFVGGMTSQTNMPMTITGTANMGVGFAGAVQLAFVNNSTVTMTSTGNNTLTGNGIWTQAANSTLFFAGNSMNITTLNADQAVNLVEYNRNGNQTIYSDAYWNLSLTTGGIKTLGGNVSLRGNWTRTASTFTPGTNRVTLNGTTNAQTINNAETFYDLTTQNSFATVPQINFTGNVTVTNLLDMNSGVINLAGFILNLTSTGGALSHAGTANLGWAYDGTITRAFPNAAITLGGQDGLIPIGTGREFRPFFYGKSNNGSSAASISMRHVDLNTTTSVNIPDTGPAATIIIRRDTRWESTLSGGSGATWSISYGGTGLGVVANVNHLRSMLLNSVIATNVVGSGTTTNIRAGRSALTQAQMTNNFYIGSTNAATTLPVTIVSFKAVAKTYGVELLWKTESELNNDYFTILHQADGSEFKPIGTVAGNGTTNEGHQYSLTHYKPVIGKNYYSLSQTDFDGKSSNYGIVMVEVFKLNELQVSIYPNPVSQNRQINLQVNGIGPAGVAEFEILDMKGISIKRLTGTADETGTIETVIDFSNQSAGMYILRSAGGYIKFVVE